MDESDSTYIYQPEPEIGAGFSWASTAITRYNGPLMWSAILRLGLELTDLALGAPSAIQSWSNERPAGNPYQFHGSALDISTWISLAGLLLLAKAIVLVVSSALVFATAKMAADGEMPSVPTAWKRIPWVTVVGLACLGFANIVFGRIVLSRWSIIPGVIVIVNAISMLLLAISVDDHVGLIGVAKRVVETLRKHPLLTLGSALLAGFIGSVGRALCGVGVLLTVPFSALFLLFMYRALAGKDIVWWEPAVPPEESD